MTSESHFWLHYSIPHGELASIKKCVYSSTTMRQAKVIDEMSANGFSFTPKSMLI